MGQGSGCPKQDQIRLPPKSEALADLLSGAVNRVVENINIIDFCRQSVIDSGVQCDRCTPETTMWWNTKAFLHGRGSFYQRQKQNKTQLVIIVHRHLFEVQYVYVDLPQ
jgi:hypothetical protein